MEGGEIGLRICSIERKVVFSLVFLVCYFLLSGRIRFFLFLSFSLT